MSWSRYAGFLAIAVVLVLVPGPDFTVVVKNLLIGGRRRALATSVGIACSNATQGAAAALGLGTLITRSQPLFQTLRWAGVGYLAYLGAQALRSAWRPRPSPTTNKQSDQDGAAVRRGWRQGYLSNITNPKVLTFYLSALPQFLTGAHPATTQLLTLALTHALLSLLWLSALVTVLGRARHWLTHRRVRRGLDAATAAALLGFSARLATQA